MTRLACALVLLAVGCGAEGNEAPEGTQAPAAPVAAPASEPVAAARPDQARAFEIVRASFERGMSTASLLREAPTVRWSETLCPTPSADGSMKTAVFDQEGHCYAGLTYEGCDLRVAWRGSFSASAFSHELMHCVLDRAGRPDPDHTREPGAWAIAQDADHALATAGL